MKPRMPQVHDGNNGGRHSAAAAALPAVEGVAFRRALERLC